jgi:hypothetical protein
VGIGYEWASENFLKITVGTTTMASIEEEVKAYVDEVVGEVVDEVMVEFRRSYVDHLRSSISEEFKEGQEALDRLEEEIERLESSVRAREDSLGGEGTGAGAGVGAGDIYSMMTAIEQQAARVEQRMENLSGEALAIVSSALDVAAGADGENGENGENIGDADDAGDGADA